MHFERQGTIGVVSPDGQAELFVVLPEGSIANGIRFGPPASIDAIRWAIGGGTLRPQPSAAMAPIAKTRPVTQDTKQPMKSILGGGSLATVHLPRPR